MADSIFHAAGTDTHQHILLCCRIWRQKFSRNKMHRCVKEQRTRICIVKIKTIAYLPRTRRARPRGGDKQHFDEKRKINKRVKVAAETVTILAVSVSTIVINTTPVYACLACSGCTGQCYKACASGCGNGCGGGCGTNCSMIETRGIP